MTSHTSSDTSEDEELLDLLQKQCAASLGLKAKRRRLSPSPEAQDPQSEEEWTGFASESEEEAEEETVVFQDPSRFEHEAGSKERYRDFMVCLYSLQSYSVHGLI